ncbi:Nose resistant to fluoxetine protein 6, partial [Stegodyphus mimosarum]
MACFRKILFSFVFILNIYQTFSKSTSKAENGRGGDTNYDLVGNLKKVSDVMQKSADIQAKPGHELNFAEVNILNLFHNDAINFMIHNYTSFGNSSSSCFRDIQYTLQNLGNMKEQWAMHMIDAFGKPESGFLQGNTRFIGDYNECLNVYAPPQENTTAGNFHGKYCFLQVPFLKLGNFSLSSTFGVCIPDTCSSTLLMNDFKNVLEIPKFVSAMNNIGGILNDTSLTCNPVSKKLTPAAIVVICLMSVFGFLALLGSSVTAYEYFNTNQLLSKNVVSEVGDSKKVTESNGVSVNALEDNGDEELLFSKPKEGILEKWKPFLKCFCIFTNGSKLLNTDGTEGQLLCIHGIRFLSMTWVILGHTYLFCISVIRSPLNLLTVIDNWPFQIILQGFYSVDSFFVISGFLLTYLFFQEYSKKGGKMSWAYFYIHRYLRLTPVYMLILAFSATVYFYLGSGPFWPTTTTDANCKTYWWMNLLYINNFQDQQNGCMGWSWYLANDMQFFVISPLFLISLWRWPKIGYSLLGLFLCGTFLANFFITYEYDIICGMSYLTSMKINEADKFLEFFNKIYIKPYTRIGPYLVGMFVGYFLFKTKQSNRGKDSWITLGCGWIIASSVTLTCVYGLYHKDPSVLACSFYNALNRTCYGAGLCWVIYVCLTKQAGIVDSILSWKLFIPLSRLTYCAYLIHPMVITGYFSSLKSLLEVSHPTLVLYFLGFLVVTYGLSLPVSLIFESPIIGLEKLIRNKFQARKL